VTVLGVLWVLAALAFAAGSAALVLRGGARGLWAVFAVVAGLALAGASGLSAYGLLTRAPWARFLQLGLAVLGLFTPFFIPAAAVLVYFLRNDVGVVFSGRRDWAELTSDEEEMLREGGSDLAFAGMIAATVVLTLAVGGLVAAGRRGAPAPPPEADEGAALGRVRAMIGAQDAFRGGTCGNGYADLEGLTKPANVIPNYPADAAPFLSPESAQAEQAGYRFELKVDNPLPAAEGCPKRSFGSYLYTATPVTPAGDVRSFAVGPDRAIHAATGRPATKDDPALP
jgi:hypothetical protein